MQTNEFNYEHPSGLRISRILREPEVASVDGVSKRDMGTGNAWYSLPGVACGTEVVLISLCFRTGHLASVSVAVDDVDPGGGWNAWSAEKERTRVKQTEAWLVARGFAPGTYPWGEIGLEYDAKGGSGSATIRYRG